MTDGPADERCHSCGRLDPINCPCPLEDDVYLSDNELATKETADAVLDVAEERVRQVAKWGVQSIPLGGNESWVHAANEARRIADARDKEGTLTWADVLLEEVFETLAETDPAKFREELVQVAAVAVAAIEDIDREAADAERSRVAAEGAVIDQAIQEGRLPLRSPADTARAAE